MNSIIISFIYGLILRFIALLSDSAVWRFFGRIHSGFSKSFSKSLIVSEIKKERVKGVGRGSVACMILRIPTAILSALCRFASGMVRDFVKNSVLAELARGYNIGILTVDIRFFSIIFVFAGVSAFIVSILTGVVEARFLYLTVLGFVLFFVNIRLADYVDDSIVVRFIKSSFGFEDISFKASDKKCGFSGYAAALIAGIIAGAGGLHPILFAAPVAIGGLTLLVTYPILGVFMALFCAPILPTMAVVGISVLTIISSLIQRAYTGRYKIKMGRCGICLVLFLVISFISVVFSFARGGSIAFFGMYLIFISFYFCVRNSIRKSSTLEAILKIITLSATAVAVYGILQYLFGWTTKNAWIDTEMFEDATMRVYSTLANPNVLGEYLILALPVCALVMLEYAKGAWQKLVYAVFFAILLVCLVLTQSRGCWIGFFVSAAIFVTYYKSSLWKILPFIIILLPLVLPETIINRFLSVGDMSDSSTSYRVYIWYGTMLMLQHFWIGGIGPGEAAFRNIYPYYSYSGIIAPHSHNLYLQLVVESGIANLGVFIVCMLMFFKDMVNVQNTGRKYGCAATMFISAMAGFLVQSMFDYTFYNFRIMGFFFMMLALGGALADISKKEALSNEKNN